MTTDDKLIMSKGVRLVKWLADHLAFEFLWWICKGLVASAFLSVVLGSIGVRLINAPWWEIATWAFSLLIGIPWYLSSIGLLPAMRQRARSLEDIFISPGDSGPTIIINQHREDIVGINIRVVNRWPVDLDLDPMPLDIIIEGRSFGSVSIEPSSPKIRAGEHCQYYHDHKNLTRTEVDYIKSCAPQTTCLALRVNGKFRYREKSQAYVKPFSFETRVLVSFR